MIASPLFLAPASVRLHANSSTVRLRRCWLASVGRHDPHLRQRAGCALAEIGAEILPFGTARQQGGEQLLRRLALVGRGETIGGWGRLPRPRGRIGALIGRDLREA